LDRATWTATLLNLLICGAILSRIWAARKGKKLFIRRIPGLDALDEAIGRATEMGRPILFVPGMGGIDIPTFAAIRLFDYVARKTAVYGTRLMAVTANPQIFPMLQDMYSETYAAAGQSASHDSANIQFLSGDQSAYASTVAGMIIREKVSAVCFFGSFGFESLLMSETGRKAGAIQIAGTDAFYQIPFFIATCDYTIIGEELYAASAYVSREPTMLGSLLGQDVGKALLILLIVTGVAFATARGFLIGNPEGARIFTWFDGLVNR
jgi:hypothetical protein